MPRVLKHMLLTTVEDPYDQKSWSGTPYCLRVALERKVQRLSVFKPGPPKRTAIDVSRRLWYGGKPPKYPLWMTSAALKQTAREVRAEIERIDPDAVLSISSQCVAYLENPGVPAFMISDSPWLAWREAYAAWDTMPVRGGEFAADEARAARRLDGLCFGSKWACDEAVRLYSTSGESLAGKLHVTLFGANWTPSIDRSEVLARVGARALNELELLYVGKDWERKGGPMAVEVARLLHDAGHKVRLHIVGCRPELPPEITGPDGFIAIHGLLFQSDPQQSAQLAELFLRSHFLLVPTTAECFGIVFAEAQAFGLPPVSRSVHALPSVILDGVTGLLLDRDAPASAYVARILALIADRTAYLAMAFAARERFEEFLNWDKTAEEVVRLVSAKLVSDHSHRGADTR